MKKKFKPKNILVTGGKGFLGFNYINYLLKNYSNLKIVNVDKNSQFSIRKKIINNSKNEYFYIKCNINNKIKIRNILKKYSIDTVINFAAESHVDRSILKPEYFFKNNMYDTIKLISSCLEVWGIKEFNNKKFIQISTDEVFGSTQKHISFNENSKYNPSSPYSASKAAVDLALNSFNKTYEFPYIIIHCCNNFGPYQNKEKFIPTIINSCVNKKKIPIYGTGLNERQWIHVDDNCEAIDKIMLNGKISQNYNIGTKNILSNINLVKKICTFFTKKCDPSFSYINLIKYVNDRPGHDFKYNLNYSKIKKKLKWHEKNNFDKKLEYTLEWYLDNLKYLN